MGLVLPLSVVVLEDEIQHSLGRYTKIEGMTQENMHMMTHLCQIDRQYCLNSSTSSSAPFFLSNHT